MTNKTKPLFTVALRVSDIFFDDCQNLKKSLQSVERSINLTGSDDYINGMRCKNILNSVQL